MARIPEYNAPDRELSASDKGANAFEQAGRRIGPAYNEAATLTRQAGEAQAAIIRQRRWPFDMLELERSLEEPEKPAKGSSGGKSGGGFKLAGGVNNLYNEREGIPSERGDSKSSRSRLGNDVGATSMAAGALGRLASRMGANGQYHNSEIDPDTGIDMKLMKPPKTMQLVNGELVPAGKKGEAGALKNDWNGEQAANAFNRANASGAFDDPKVRKAYTDKYGVDPVTGKMDSRSSYTGGGSPDFGMTRGGDTGIEGAGPNFGMSPSGQDAFAPDSSVMPRAYGSAPSDFWSDITNGLGGVLKAGITGEWPGSGGDYGGGSDGELSDLSGEGAR